MTSVPAKGNPSPLGTGRAAGGTSRPSMTGTKHTRVDSSSTTPLTQVSVHGPGGSGLARVGVGEAAVARDRRGASPGAIDRAAIGRCRAIGLLRQQTVVARAAQRPHAPNHPSWATRIGRKGSRMAKIGRGYAPRRLCYQPRTPSGITKRVMAKARVVTLTAGASAAATRGHPWIWREGVTAGGQGLEAGEVVELRDSKGTVLGQATLGSNSPLAARVYARTPTPLLDADLLAQGIERAIARRAPLALDPKRPRTGSVTERAIGAGRRHRSLRRCCGASARWRCDRALARRARQPTVARLAGARCPLPRAPGRATRIGGAARAATGDPPPATVTIRENGMAMVVDLAHGQKTGAFLDQRDNRKRVRDLAQGRRVLNLFSYAGGFSIAAALGGATRTTSVDLAQAAHADRPAIDARQPHRSRRARIRDRRCVCVSRERQGETRHLGSHRRRSAEFRAQ